MNLSGLYINIKRASMYQIENKYQFKSLYIIQKDVQLLWIKILLQIWRSYMYHMTLCKILKHS